MKTLQTFLLGTLLCVIKGKGQPSTPSDANDYLPAEIEAAEKVGEKIAYGNAGNTSSSRPDSVNSQIVHILSALIIYIYIICCIFT